MKTPLCAVLAATLTLSACGGVRDSKLNPFNWFGRSQSQPTTITIAGETVMNDNRALVTEVTQLDVQKVPGGAMITAIGLPPTQGWWDAELVLVEGEAAQEGILAYRFVVAEPRVVSRVSTPQSREVSVGQFVSDQDLAEIRSILVVGERNSRSTRR